MSSDIVYLNGQFLPKPEAKVSVDDRGFIFGDGVYEATRAIKGRLFEWPRHAARLERSLKELRLDCKTPMAELEKISTELLAKNGLTSGEAYVYLQVTRGAAPRAHQFPVNIPCTIYMYAGEVASMEVLRKAGVGVITTPEIRWARCDIKSLNLIPATQAKQKAVEAGCYEALFVRDGVITEGSHSNAFAVIDGVLRTHPANNNILPGITRAVVLEIAGELQVRVNETPVTLPELSRAQEFFVTGTNSDILPVVTIDGKKVGDGKPGPITGRLYEILAKRQASA